MTNGGDGSAAVPEPVSNRLNAVANLAKAIPVYDDALRPMAVEMGRAMGTVGKAVNVALSPIRGLVWGAEQIELWIGSRVADKLEGVDELDIVTPDLSIAGPVVESLKFHGHKAELSEMFASLLAASMDRNTTEYAHPSFVSKITQMSQLDAQVLAAIVDADDLETVSIFDVHPKNSGQVSLHEYVNPTFLGIANDQFPNSSLNHKLDHIQASIENLNRLGLIDCNPDYWLSEDDSKDHYNFMIKGDFLSEVKNAQLKDGHQLKIDKTCVMKTKLCEHFANVVFR